MAEKGKFNGFPKYLFEFFNELSRNNNTSWFNQNRAKYKSIDNELRNLVEDIGNNFFHEINKEIEIEPKCHTTIARINKNSFGNYSNGVYHDHHWAAYYNKNNGKKQDCAQLYIWFNKEIFEVGFSIGTNRKEFDKFINNVINNFDFFFNLVTENNIHENYTIECNISDENQKLDFKDKKGTKEFFRNCKEAHFYKRFTEEDIDLISRPEFKDKVEEVFRDLYLIYLFSQKDNYYEIKSETDSYLEWITGNGEDEEDSKEISIEGLAGEIYLDKEKILEIEKLLQDKKQVIFYGPPGTGKTFVAQRFAKYFTKGKGSVEIIQFHPSYTYEEFMEGLRPISVKNKDEKKEISYEVISGVFKKFCDDNSKFDKRSHNHILIIDEINRGNTAKIFGELLYLLEYRNEGITLPYSNRTFEIPDNIYIIGTMNTADRSIALVDYALRRRFSFVPFFPDEEGVILGKWLEKNNKPMKDNILKVYKAINAKIQDSNFKIGYSYFMKKNLDDDGLKRVWKYEIMPLLEEYFFSNREILKQLDIDRILSKDSGEINE